MTISILIIRDRDSLQSKCVICQNTSAMFEIDKLPTMEQCFSKLCLHIDTNLATWAGLLESLVFSGDRRPVEGQNKTE